MSGIVALRITDPNTQRSEWHIPTSGVICTCGKRPKRGVKKFFLQYKKLNVDCTT